jgi:hypothetical protein
MTPTHTNKRGVRYRYYVSQAVLQNKSQAPVSVSRVPAAELEAVVTAALRKHLTSNGTEQILPDSDRELIERHVERVTLGSNGIKLRLRQMMQDAAEDAGANGTARNGFGASNLPDNTVAIHWSSPLPASIKGIIHVPAHNTPIKPDRREALLIAIANARNWMEDVMQGRAASFAAIARREGKVERHIRLLAPLAFLSPRIVSALLEGTAPGDLTVTGLARALPPSWDEQEKRVGIADL